MQELIRVLVLADSMEEARKLDKIFAHSAGFLVRRSRIPVTREQQGVADVLVIRSKSPRLLHPETNMPVVWLGAPAGEGEEVSGISAVLSSDASPAQIRAAAAAVAVGLRVEEPKGRRSDESEFSFVEPLTERELEVLNLVAEGLSNPQIARHLRVSRNTVKFHVSAIIAKLGATSRTEAVTIALKRGLIII